MLKTKGKVIMPGFFQGEGSKFWCWTFGFAFFSKKLWCFVLFVLFWGFLFVFQISVRKKPGDGNTGNRLESIVGIYREI